MPQKERTITDTFYKFSYRIEQKEDSDNNSINILLLVAIF